MSTEAVSRDDVVLLDLQAVCERISKVPQATIAKLEGFVRGGGHELALALDMRFSARGKFKLMQMEVGMGILARGGGASRMARQVGLGRTLEIILSALDFDADEAEAHWLYQATSKTPAIERFTIADEKGMEHDLENQRDWNDLVMGVQEIQ